jgi:hypothetical protein
MTDLPSHDINHVVTGAIFLTGVFVFLAYLAIQWGKK